jgi:endonuclease
MSFMLHHSPLGSVPFGTRPSGMSLEAGCEPGPQFASGVAVCGGSAGRWIGTVYGCCPLPSPIASRSLGAGSGPSGPAAAAVAGAASAQTIVINAAPLPMAGKLATGLGRARRLPVRAVSYGPEPMRLIVARCEVRYSGRLTAVLPEALRLLMIKSDGSVMVHADSGGFKPSNWMTAPTVIEETPERIEVRKHKGEDKLEILISEVVSDVVHDMGEAAALEKDGVERDLQEQLAAAPQWCGEGFRLVRREWPTDIGPVDLMCRDDEDGWIAVEIKRVATIDAVEQLTRYLDRIRLDPAMAGCRGVLAAQSIKPQARVLAESRGIACVEVDLAVLRGEREPDLTLFAA